MGGTWCYLADESADPYSCIQDGIQDGHDDCLERWDTVRLLPGATRAEAEAAHERKEYVGSAYHVSDCEVLEDKPRGEA